MKQIYYPKDCMFTEKKPYKSTIRFLPATKEELENNKIKMNKQILRIKRLEKLDKLNADL